MSAFAIDAVATSMPCARSSAATRAATLPSSVAMRSEFHRVVDDVVERRPVVARGRREAQARVQRARLVHAFERVEAERTVPDRARSVDDGGREPTAGPGTARDRPDVESLDLADRRRGRAAERGGRRVELAQRDAADRLARRPREEQPPARRRITSRERRELVVETLEGEVDLERRRVFGEELARERD